MHARQSTSRDAQWMGEKRPELIYFEFAGTYFRATDRDQEPHRYWDNSGTGVTGQALRDKPGHLGQIGDSRKTKASESRLLLVVTIGK